MVISSNSSNNNSSSNSSNNNIIIVILTVPLLNVICMYVLSTAITPSLFFFSHFYLCDPSFFLFSFYISYIWLGGVVRAVEATSLVARAAAAAAAAANPVTVTSSPVCTRS